MTVATKLTATKLTKSAKRRKTNSRSVLSKTARAENKDRLLLLAVNKPGGRDMIMSQIRQNVTTGCWEWIGLINKKGYGFVRINGVIFGAHQLVFFMFKGRSARKGLELDHLCNNRRCVNVRHLEEVTHLENVRRIKERRIARQVLATTTKQRTVI